MDDAGALVARGTETALIREVLSTLSQGPAGALIEGEPGMGKTTLWRSVCETAGLTGIRVLSARPAEAESRLTYVGLADLVRGLLPTVVEQLPRPQATALRVAARIEDPGNDGVDHHSICAGLLSVLQRASVHSPVLVAIDDLQWLDEPTARVLEYVIRRLDDIPVGVMLCGRAARTAALATALRERLPEARLQELTLSALGVDEIHRVLLSEVGQVPPHPTLVRIVAATGGNPMFAVHATRSWFAAPPRARATSSFSIPEALTSVLWPPIEQLPAPTRRALLFVALVGEPPVSLLAQTTEADVADVLEPAERAGVVRVEHGAASFSHPLYATLVRERATSAERMAAHRVLAAVVPDQEDRALHLAEAAVQPDEQTAAMLEESSHVALRRGSPEAAAELTRLALAHTPSQETAVLEGRRLHLGELLLTAGDAVAAEGILEPLTGAESQQVRVRSLLLLARIAFRRGPGPAAVLLAERALTEAHGDQAELESAALVELALLSPHDPAAGLTRARHAVTLLERGGVDNPGLLARARFAVMDCQLELGAPIDPSLAGQLPDVATDRSEPRVMDRLGYRLGNLLLAYDDMSGTRAVLERALSVAEEEGDLGSQPTILDQLGQLEVVAGRWVLARAHAERQFDLATRDSQVKFDTAALETLAAIDAREGRFVDAQARLDVVLERVRRADDRWEEAYALRTLGHLNLTLGNPRSALSALENCQQICNGLGVESPGLLRQGGDLLEAIVTTGDITRGLALAETLDQQGRTSGVLTACAAAARGEALALAHLGDLSEALASAERAVAVGRTIEAPLELGRSLVVQAQIHRRRREKRLARTALDEALTIFTHLGAVPWSDLAVRERGRLGLRPRTPNELTATESAVADLAVAGLSNPEIATRLSMSRKTVEFNLGKVYRKLGIRRRAELATARLQD